MAEHIVPNVSQALDTEELTISLSQVSIKEKEISTLKEERKALEKANKEYQEENTKLKDRLKGNQYYNQLNTQSGI